MSTILKALRRLEEDNATRTQRSLREEVMSARRPSPPPRSRSWVGVFAALFGVALLSGAGGVWFALRERPAPVAMATGEIPVSTVARTRQPERSGLSAPSPPLAAGPASAAPAPRAALRSPEPAVSEELEIAATARTTEPLPAVSASPPGRSPLEDLAMVTRPEPEAPAPVSAAPAPRLLAPQPEIESVSAEIRDPAPDPTMERNAVSEIPVVVRAQIPELVIRTTRWHPTPERRVVEIELPAEGRRVSLHEGDTLGPLVVGEITLSGVVLRHGGVEIQGRVGEMVSAE